MGPARGNSSESLNAADTPQASPGEKRSPVVPQGFQSPEVVGVAAEKRFSKGGELSLLPVSVPRIPAASVGGNSLRRLVQDLLWRSHPNFQKVSPTICAPDFQLPFEVMDGRMKRTALGESKHVGWPAGAAQPFFPTHTHTRSGSLVTFFLPLAGHPLRFSDPSVFRF